VKGRDWHHALLWFILLLGAYALVFALAIALVRQDLRRLSVVTYEPEVAPALPVVASNPHPVAEQAAPVAPGIIP
jgi:hypothetical protein